MGRYLTPAAVVAWLWWLLAIVAGADWLLLVQMEAGAVTAVWLRGHLGDLI